MAIVNDLGSILAINKMTFLSNLREQAQFGMKQLKTFVIGTNLDQAIIIAVRSTKKAYEPSIYRLSSDG